MQKNDHLAIARLEKCMLDVVVQNVHFVATDRRVSEAVGVGLEDSRQALLSHIRPDVEILEFGISFRLAEYEAVLLNQIRLLLLLGLASLVALLDLLDQAKGRIEIRAWCAQLSGLLHIGASISPKMNTRILSFALNRQKRENPYNSLRNVAFGLEKFPVPSLPIEAPGWKKLILRYV